MTEYRTAFCHKLFERVDLVLVTTDTILPQPAYRVTTRRTSASKLFLLAILALFTALKAPSLFRSAARKTSTQLAGMATNTSSNPYLGENGKESPWKYPRPPALEKTSRRLKVVYSDDGEEVVLADTTNAYRVLETSHPPTYYLPAEDVQTSLLTQNNRHTYCEWKGSATYFDFKPKSGGETIKNRIWTYETPSSSFKPIKSYFSFYVGPWKCFVDGEEVKAQPGDFYGGWMTSDIDGGKKGVKGGPGTFGW